MSKATMKKTLRDAMYLKRNGWSFEVEDGREGWIDPKTKIHYFQKDALLIQLIRDDSRHPRFAREPAPHC